MNLRGPGSDTEARDLPAQIDTAADRTVIPFAVALDLSLNIVGQVTVLGFGGTAAQTPLYVVELGVHAEEPAPLRVIASPTEPWILLGRDVLNSHRLHLDGPGLALELG